MEDELDFRENGSHLNFLKKGRHPTFNLAKADSGPGLAKCYFKSAQNPELKLGLI
jgi:hypothetical protein